MEKQTAVHKRLFFFGALFLKGDGGRGNPTEKREQLKKKKEKEKGGKQGHTPILNLIMRTTKT